MTVENLRDRLRAVQRAAEDTDGVVHATRERWTDADGESEGYVYISLYLSEYDGQLSVLSSIRDNPDAPLNQALADHNFEIQQLKGLTKTTNKLGVWVGPREQESERFEERR